jgi:hypothetical protein
MLKPQEQEAVRLQDQQDEAEMRKFIGSHGGKVVIAEPYISVSFGKDQDSDLAGKTFKASSWRNLRAIIKDEGSVSFS